MSDSLRPVNVGACRCPGTPHSDGDVVSLDIELSTPAGIAAQAALSQGGGWEDLYAGMLMGLMRHSVREWTFRDEDGPVPVSPSNVEKHLPWLRGGKEVAGMAAELYAQTILDPFVAASKAKRSAKKIPTPSSSLNGSTATASTSPTPLTRPKRRSA